MPYRGEVFTQGQYYHIYNRGAGKQKIFFNEANYAYLLRQMALYSRQYGATPIAYCLMPNHYHFLLRQESDEPLSKFINVLFTSYVQAVNKQQGRTGALFEGRFRYRRVADLSYVLRLTRYIHMNPVKAGLASCPEEWQYSDYRAWIGLSRCELGDPSFIRSNFSTGSEYREFVADMGDQARHRENLLEYVWD
jgi:putative transposase